MKERLFLRLLNVCVAREAPLARDGCSKYVYLHFRRDYFVFFFFFSSLSKISVIPHASFPRVLIARAQTRARERYAYVVSTGLRRSVSPSFLEFPITSVTSTMHSSRSKREGPPDIKCSRAITVDLTAVTRLDETR